MALIFEWDDEKAKKNQRKHKVNFEEARTVFGDPLLVSFEYEYSYDGGGLIGIGASRLSKTLLVVHAEMSERRRSIVRLISARKATAYERRVYKNN